MSWVGKEFGHGHRHFLKNQKTELLDFLGNIGFVLTTPTFLIWSYHMSCIQIFTIFRLTKGARKQKNATLQSCHANANKNLQTQYFFPNHFPMMLEKLGGDGLKSLGGQIFFLNSRWQPLPETFVVVLDGGGMCLKFSEDRLKKSIFPDWAKMRTTKFYTLPQHGYQAIGRVAIP